MSPIVLTTTSHAQTRTYSSEFQPDGYRKKRRKKKSELNEEDTIDIEEDEELPDTSIVSKDPYGGGEGAKEKTKSAKKSPKKSPAKKSGAAKSSGKGGKTSTTKKRK